MRLKIIGSSSKGNCYILENDETALIIECGVKINDIKAALGFNFQKVAGCLVSHEHGDHGKAAEDVLKLGIPLYTSRGTARALELQINHHRLNIIEAKRMVEIGPWKVIPFKIEHDVVEPLGFIINHAECGNVLFITDSIYVRDTFYNINNVLIEANFSQEIIDRKLKEGTSPEFLRNRIFKSHMSLETCKNTLLANDLSKVHNIVLIHLSDSNSNASQFQKEITELTGKKVHVADAGVIIENFNKTAF